MVDDGVADLRLRLFGPMRFERGADTAGSLPDQLFKSLSLLVLNGGCMNRDTLVERLWPDAAVDAGRHQLRNLLSRLRALPLRIDRQGDLVVLRDAVWCDVEEFIRIAARAVAGIDGPDETVRLGLHAQELWRGPPLEAWRYEPWAIHVRSRAFMLQERLWETLARMNRPERA